MTFGGVLRGELTKMLALRSTRWTLAVLVVATVGFSALFSVGAGSGHHTGDVDAANLSQSGLFFGQLAIAVLGVLSISGEYGTGAIRGTFTAVPRRWMVLAAKAVVIVLVALPVGLVCSFGAFFAARPVLASAGYPLSLGHSDVLRAVIGGGLYVAASGLFGFALGALLRRTPVAIVAALALLLVLPPLTGLLPGGWGSVVQRYFTSIAGSEITTTMNAGNDLGPWVGYGVFCLWWAVILGLAFVVVQRRDA